MYCTDGGYKHHGPHHVLLLPLVLLPCSKWPATSRMALGMLAELAGAFPPGALGAPHVELLQALDAYVLLYHRCDRTQKNSITCMKALHAPWR